MFWHNEEYAIGLGNDIYLDGVVAVVDAVFGEQVSVSTSYARGRGSNLMCASTSKC